MKERILTGVALVVVVFAFLLFSSDYLFGAGVFLVALMSFYEWLSLIKINKQEMFRFFVLFSIIIFLVAQFFVYFQYIYPVYWLYAVYRLFSYEYEKISDMQFVEMLVMGIFTISPFVASLYILHSNGVAWIFMFILIIAAADSGAYFVGKAIGKRKMLPRLSPNKTIEGLLGGLVCSIVVAVIFLAYMDLSLGQYIYMVVVSIFVALLSVIGDVFESMIKRIAGVKDSGNILPGHGGILDRIDGYMPSLPIFVLLGYLAGVFII